MIQDKIHEQFSVSHYHKKTPIIVAIYNMEYCNTLDIILRIPFLNVIVIAFDIDRLWKCDQSCVGDDCFTIVVLC